MLLEPILNAKDFTANGILSLIPVSQPRGSLQSPRYTGFRSRGLPGRLAGLNLVWLNLARQMGIELVEGRDLVTHDNIVYMRTTAGCGGWM